MIDAARKRIEPVVARLKEQITDPSRFGQRKWIAYGALLAVSLLLFLALGGSRRYPDLPAEMKTTASGGAAETGTPGLRILPGRAIPGEVPVTWETWGRDPFSTARSAPVAQPDNPSSGLAISGISWRDGEGIVLIGDLVLREGETVRGLEIVNILPGCVVLERDGRKVVLCMGGEG